MRNIVLTWWQKRYARSPPSRWGWVSKYHVAITEMHLNSENVTLTGTLPAEGSTVAKSR